MSFFGFDAEIPGQNFTKVQKKERKKGKHRETKFDKLNDDTFGDGAVEDDSWQMGAAVPGFEDENTASIIPGNGIKGNNQIDDPAIRSFNGMSLNGGFQDPAIQGFQDPAIQGFGNNSQMNNQYQSQDQHQGQNQVLQGFFEDPAIKSFQDPAIQNSGNFENSTFQNDEPIEDVKKEKKAKKAKKEKKSKKKKSEKEQEELALKKLEDQQKRDEEFKKQTETIKNIWGEEPAAVEPKVQPAKVQTQSTAHLQHQQQPKGPPTANAHGFNNSRSSNMNVVMPNQHFQHREDPLDFQDPSIVSQGRNNFQMQPQTSFQDPSIVQAVPAGRTPAPKLSSRPPPGLPPGFDKKPPSTSNQPKTLAEIEQELLSEATQQVQEPQNGQHQQNSQSQSSRQMQNDQQMQNGQQVQNGQLIQNSQQMQNGYMQNQYMQNNHQMQVHQNQQHPNMQNPMHNNHCAPAQLNHEQTKSPAYKIDFPTLSEGLDPTHLALLKNQAEKTPEAQINQQQQQQQQQQNRQQINNSHQHQNQHQNNQQRQQQNPNRNYRNDKPNYRDKFANLMSHREKRFVVEIQMKQLRTTDPLADDYYYANGYKSTSVSVRTRFRNFLTSFSTFQKKILFILQNKPQFQQKRSETAIHFSITTFFQHRKHRKN